MKIRNSAIMFLIACSFAYEKNEFMQASKGIPTDNRQLSPEEWRLKVVAHLITLPSPAKGYLSFCCTQWVTRLPLMLSKLSVLRGA